MVFFSAEKIRALFKKKTVINSEPDNVPALLLTLKNQNMFNFKISIAITDESNNEVTTFTLPKIESGENLGNVLSIAESLVKPFLPAVTQTMQTN
jgi:hypothetical protein